MACRGVFVSTQNRWDLPSPTLRSVFLCSCGELHLLDTPILLQRILRFAEAALGWISDQPSEGQAKCSGHSGSCPRHLKDLSQMEGTSAGPRDAVPHPSDTWGHFLPLRSSRRSTRQGSLWASAAKF